jgi:hypothetical protein
MRLIPNFLEGVSDPRCARLARYSTPPVRPRYIERHECFVRLNLASIVPQGIEAASPDIAAVGLEYRGVETELLRPQPRLAKAPLELRARVYHLRPSILMVRLDFTVRLEVAGFVIAEEQALSLESDHRAVEFYGVEVTDDSRPDYCGGGFSNMPFGV